MKGIQTLVVPHLYDLRPDGPGVRALREIRGSFAVLSWLYNRAAQWVLDQYDVRGHVGQTSLKHVWDQRMEQAEESEKRGHGPRRHDPPPSREVFHLDLRLGSEARLYLDEINRLIATRRPHAVESGPAENESQSDFSSGGSPAEPTVIVEPVSRRWYPVIDFSRCTNCMECIDFCLFGVYGIDQHETIIVEQPDNCRKGCPACSRVCPENAIMFPQHKTPEIAGDPV